MPAHGDERGRNGVTPGGVPAARGSVLGGRATSRSREAFVKRAMLRQARFESSRLLENELGACALRNAAQQDDEIVRERDP